MKNLTTIKVKYLGATNNLGNRLRFTLPDGSFKTVSRDYSTEISTQIENFINKELSLSILGKVSIDSDTDIIVLRD